ncbi:MAG TPA: hypothetical protein VJA18_04975 [Candidatus Nanoarchaeia archaeon]|nr:hypothetical protein [Candidatus Nanoarchaeia archaeon]
MEQYWVPKRLDFKHLRLCLSCYQAEELYIRDCGGYDAQGRYRLQGEVKVRERLEGRTLDLHKDKSGLHLLIDAHKIFHFPLKKDYDKGFSLAYERIEDTDDGVGRMVMLGTGIDPYVPTLPEPRRSFLRQCLDNHLMEIFFKGRVHLKFHSWWQEPHWKYWQIVKEKPTT